ncbi:MAG: cytochrome c [Thermodesulfovibrionia bacterium]|nr:cytochrome c [Thermodesulfovibrionia bacterium]
MKRTLILIIVFSFLNNLSAYAEEEPVVLEGSKLYAHYCAVCHGVKGDGKGFNAKNLDPRPADHTDAELMSRRSDKDLYDVIYGGGKMAGKSVLMPPWGNTFSKAQVDSLVLYLRRLCKCQGS